VAASPWFQNAERVQIALLEAYRSRDWHRASELVTELRLVAEDRLEGLCGVYARRIEALRTAPLPPDWDGVFAAVEK